jgi:Putative zinc-finger
MDHAYIEEHDILRRYLAGRLPGEDRDRFEAHYVDCEQCLERLELEEGFREGVREIAAEEVARTVERGFFLRLLLSRTGRALLAASLAVLVAVPFGVLLSENRDLDRRLAAAEESLARPAAPAPAPLAPRAEAGEIRQERDRLAGELGQERQARAAAEERLVKAEAPRVNLPVFLLASVRGEGAGEDVNRLDLTPGTDWVVLATELALVEHESYRATLRTAGGRRLWSGEGLRPDARDTLTVAFPSALLPAGGYELAIEGRTAAGGWEGVSRSRLRVGKGE